MCKAVSAILIWTGFTNMEQRDKLRISNRYWSSRMSVGYTTHRMEYVNFGQFPFGKASLLCNVLWASSNIIDMAEFLVNSKPIKYEPIYRWLYTYSCSNLGANRLKIVYQLSISFYIAITFRTGNEFQIVNWQQFFFLRQRLGVQPDNEFHLRVHVS